MQTTTVSASTSAMESAATAVASVHSQPKPTIFTTAQIAMTGALTMTERPIETRFWIWVMSFVQRLTSDAAPKRSTSPRERSSAWLKTFSRRVRERPAATREAR